MTAFLIIGAIGLLILLTSLILDDIFDAFDITDLGFISGPAIGAFLAALGFGAALTLYATDASAGRATIVGLGAGVIIGAIATVITRTLMHMPTDPSISTIDLVGRTAVVITPIAEGRYGEVTIRHAGQSLKLNARADGPIPAGRTVSVVAVMSSSSVVVAIPDQTA